MGFEAFAADVQAYGWNVHGAELYEDGVLTGSFGDTESKFPVYSATKSVLSIAAGMAWDRERISFEKSVLDYLPGVYVSAMRPEQTAAYRSITLHRLMTMSVEGYPFRPEGENYLKFCLDWPVQHPEKRVFHYSNIPACLAGIALSEALEEDVWAFLERELLAPLEIRDARYARCPEGFFYGASGMDLSVHDLSRIGLLLYRGGMAGRERIVSRDYVNLATSPLQRNREGGYGYFFWKYRNGFSINGKWKQRCCVLPERKLVISFLSDIRDDSDALIKSMERHILDA